MTLWKKLPQMHHHCVSLREINASQKKLLVKKRKSEPDDVGEFEIDEREHGKVRIGELLGVLEDLGALDGFVGRELFEGQAPVRTDQHKLRVPVGQ
jgi:hypothetical protein